MCMYKFSFLSRASILAMYMYYVNSSRAQENKSIELDPLSLCMRRERGSSKGHV